jgi:hypothetical protein
MDKQFRLLIDGQLVPGAATFDVINPATETVLAQAPRADRPSSMLPSPPPSARFPPGRRAARMIAPR